jgi:hypothetical protein
VAALPREISADDRFARRDPEDLPWAWRNAAQQSGSRSRGYSLLRVCQRAWRQPDVAGERVTVLAPVNALPHVGVQSYDVRAAARYVLCIRKEVLAMFANRQTPPGVAL